MTGRRFYHQHVAETKLHPLTAVLNNLCTSGTYNTLLSTAGTEINKIEFSVFAATKAETRQLRSAKD